MTLFRSACFFLGGWEEEGYMRFKILHLDLSVYDWECLASTLRTMCDDGQ